MSFLALLSALTLSYYRPHLKPDLLQYLFAPYAAWLEHNFNDSRRRHGVIAWLMGAFFPSLLVGVIYYALLKVSAVAGLVFGIAVLYFVLRFNRFGRPAEKIVTALRNENLGSAREIYAKWENDEKDNYTAPEIARLSIESTLKHAHHGLFAPILWFVILGPAGACLYRLSHLLKQAWQPQQQNEFNHFARRVFGWLDWLPARLTAGSFAVVGDFEDAIYCWRMQARSWPDQDLGIVLASGAGALGTRLGEPLSSRGVLQFRPELGLGDEADADYLQSAIGLIWRVLILMLGILLLLTFAHWLGN
ncbi:MAG TPA: CobD/CbiB family protein [Methylophilaceae bacterium]|nr:CobD/CbiB family protein [Methylophilaceae bacterium]